jgi:superfamily II DNA or RNA helicase
LRDLLEEQAAYRSAKKPANQAIMQHKIPVVVIMVTGAGKRVLFTFLAFVSS